MRVVTIVIVVVALALLANEMIKAWRCVNILQHYYHTTGELNAKMAQQVTRYQCWADPRK